MNGEIMTRARETFWLNTSINHLKCHITRSLHTAHIVLCHKFPILIFGFILHLNFIRCITANHKITRSISLYMKCCRQFGCPFICLLVHILNLWCCRSAGHCSVFTNNNNKKINSRLFLTGQNSIINRCDFICYIFSRMMFFTWSAQQLQESCGLEFFPVQNRHTHTHK